MGEMLLNGRLYGANGVMEITQAQYDALPATKYTDGILYCIKDSGIVEGDKYAPVIYSLEEKEIGVWTDGKPLYSKTVHITSLPSSTSTSGVDYPHNISNIDTICTYDATARWSGGQSTHLNHSVFTSGAQNSSITIVVSKTDINIVVGIDRSSMDADVTIYYTKTTDVAGSGSWGTDGVPMVHYDGNEKIIGTWFGDTLYEQTIEVTSISSGAEKSFAHGISNIDMVVDCKGYAYNGNDHKSFLSFIVPNDINSNTSGINGRYVFAISNADRTNIVCAVGSGIVSQLTKLVFTVQYTKTS